MRRRIFNILCALSLILCLAMAALWVRSYWFHDELGCVWPLRPDRVRRGVHVSSIKGTLFYEHGINGPISATSPVSMGDISYRITPAREYAAPLANLRRWGSECFGFGIVRSRYDRASTRRIARFVNPDSWWNQPLIICVPHWFVI